MNNTASENPQSQVRGISRNACGIPMNTSHSLVKTPRANLPNTEPGTTSKIQYPLYSVPYGSAVQT